MDTGAIGVQAAKLMEDLDEMLPDNARLLHTTLIVAVERDIDDETAEVLVHFVSSADRRLEQVGVLATAQAMAIEADADDDE